VYVKQALTYLRRNLVETALTVDNNLVASLFKIIDCLFGLFINR
jgi:hypothetical protein